MAIVGTLKTFKGGRYFSKLEGAPSLRIDTAPLPPQVRVPLRQGFGDEPDGLVRVGDRVKVGQPLARSDEKISTPVPAPISGEVIAIEEGVHPLDGKPTAIVVIESDGQDEWQVLNLPAGSYAKWGREALGRVLYEAGVTALGKAGFPTAFRSSDVEPSEISHLVINAVETEPYVRGDLALLYEEFDKFVTGIRILKEALGNVEVHVGVGHDQPHIFEELTARLEYHDWAYIHPLLPKYPQGADEVLIKTLLGREVPAGRLPTAIGVVVCDVQTVVAAYEAVLEGKPFVERVISLGGSAAKRPRCVRVRLGTPVGDVLEAFGHEAPARVILGGPLRGASVSDIEAPITRDVRAITLLREPGGRRVWAWVPALRRGRRATTALNGEPRPCIRCGDCLDVCPQNLTPIGLSEAVRQGDLRRAEGQLDLFACIECGLCSYVCPAKISLLEDIRRGKRWILEEQLEA
jgi:electron transport complex protein RnfC